MHTDFRDEWLSKLAGRLNIPRLAFDDAGLCVLNLDQELLVSMYKQTDASNLVLFGLLPIADSQMTPALMRRMLIENRNHAKQTAPVVSIPDGASAIEVHFTFNQDELQSVGDAMGMLVGSLEYWRSVVKGT